MSYYIPERKTPKSLAVELAGRASLMPSQIIYLLTDDKEEDIDGIYRLFQEYLIADLSEEDFADIYAQTITYGLFAARLRQKNKEEFNRNIAADLLPKNIKVLHDTFTLISSNALPEPIAVYVDDIATVLAHADIEKIKADLLKEKGDDPLIHFYETFLGEYDAKKRKSRGIYYTPLPVVSFITRSINALLKEKFDKSLGFAEKGVTLLDPAAGTLTFPAQAIKLAKKETDNSAQPGSWKQIAKKDILENFHAFEIEMAPYIIGHLKMALLFEELGYKLGKNERFKLYLTDTLDFEEHKGSPLPGLPAALTEEAEEAMKVKTETPIMVVLGNPPYFGASQNKGDWILKQIEVYKEIDGEPLGERNIKWINDDYVKFFRFAQWKIEQSGKGVLGFITNHAWLDNPTFRGMRASFLKTFNEIYIVNLHGSTLKKEKTPAGGKDENVFDIQPGVAITLGVKIPDATDHRVYYIDQWGTRKKKQKWLNDNDVRRAQWDKLEAEAPHYFFVPRDTEGKDTYDNFVSIPDIFPVNSVGIVTARDKLTIHWTENEVWNTVSQFSKMDPELARSAFRLGKDSKDWKVVLAQQDLKNTGPEKSKILPILYRPFDIRYTYYTGKSKGFHCRPRPEVMQHMMEDNLALLTSRMTKGETFKHALVSDTISEVIMLSSKTSNNAFVFPLYLYNSKKPQEDLFSASSNKEKEPNLNPKIWEAATKTLGNITPEEFFYYIYAVLYSNIYREKYQEFLKIDFPRVPITSDKKLFQKLSALGKKLVNLHLLKNGASTKSKVSFKGKGESVVGKRKYNKKERCVYINDDQYFEEIDPEIWNYHIGGYQVLDKWLKDRKGRVLSRDDIAHYLKITAAIRETMKLQKKIDKLYPKVEDELVEI